MMSAKAEGDVQGIFHDIFQSSPDKLKQEVNWIYSTPAKVYSVNILFCITLNSKLI